MSQGKPHVSLGMPIYNGGRYVAATIDAFLVQTYTDFELVISDNASTDSTEAICRRYAQQDPRIIYHRHDVNAGAAWNYNKVFELARGDYFKWAAADDLILPEMLEKATRVLDENPDVILSYPKTTIIDGKGKVMHDYDDNLHLDAALPSERFSQLLCLVGECNAVFGLVRCEVLARTHLIGNFIGSDITLLAELALYGKFYEINERLFLRREHVDASSWDKGTERQLEFFDPKLKGKIVLPNWRRWFENFNSLFRAPLSRKEKVTIFLLQFRNLVSSRKNFIGEFIIALRQLGARFR